MDLRVPEQERHFREEVRAFLDEALTPEILEAGRKTTSCLLYTSPSPRDRQKSRMPSSA